MLTQVNTTTNTVTLQNVNQTITVVDNNNGNNVNVTQPLVNVIEVAIPGTIGPQGPVGPSGSFPSTGSFATTGSNIFIGTQTITGSIFVSGSLISTSFTGSLQGIATTASYVLNAVSSSFSSTASFVNPLTQSVLISGSTNINGNTQITGSLIVANPTPNGGITMPIVSPTNFYPTLTIATTTFEGFQSSGNLMTISNTGYSIQFGSNPGQMLLRSAGNHVLQSGASNITRLFISSSGNIGIAKSSSLNATLDIIGNQIITGSLTVTNGITGSLQGTSSFSLTSSYLNPLNQSLIITGSVLGNVTALSISTNTASLDLSLGSFYTLQLSPGTNTFINPTNIKAGETVSLLVSTAGSATVSFPSIVLQPSGSSYVPTTTTSKDVLTFISFDNTNLYLASVKNLI